MFKGFIGLGSFHKAICGVEGRKGVIVKRVINVVNIDGYSLVMLQGLPGRLREYRWSVV